MQDARGSRRNKNTKRNPHPPKKQGETTEKTRQGDPTHPEERRAGHGGGRGKHGKGKPTHPEERRKTPLGKEEPEEEKRQNFWGCHALLKAARKKLIRGNASSYSPSHCGGHCPPSHVNTPNETKQQHKNHYNPILPILSVVLMSLEKNKSSGRCTPHPRGDPEKPEQDGKTRPEA